MGVQTKTNRVFAARVSAVISLHMIYFMPILIAIKIVKRTMRGQVALLNTYKKERRLYKILSSSHAHTIWTSPGKNGDCDAEFLQVSCNNHFVKAPTALSTGHFTVVCLVTWPCIGSEAGSDLVLIQTSMFFICNCKLVSIWTAWSTHEKQWGLYQNKVTSSLASNPRPSR